MSSAPRNDGPSPTPDDAPPGEEALAAIVRMRGSPLLEALERSHPGSREHAEATGSYAFATAAALGLGRGGAELCRETAKLADIGKVYGPENHHEAGARLALGAGIPTDVCGWLLQIRERFDGSGPEGLAGEAIPIASRVARAAGVCESALTRLTSERITAGLAGRRESAIAALNGAVGSELDPGVVAALAGVLERAGR